tara:strand:- start:862 stop:1422 length:561 start_codon:yes stop_codon:yes gene_type:complete
MNKLLAFGASSSKNSRNKKLASYVANRMAPKEAILVDLNEFEMPIYSEDREQEIGIPDKAYEFKKLVNESIGIIISLAEHNGSYTSAFKNIYDWISVIETKVWGNKPLILLSTSDGQNAGKTVLQTALSRFSRQSKQEIPHFSLPNFNENFSDTDGIINKKLSEELDKQIGIFSSQVDNLLDSGNN